MFAAKTRNRRDGYTLLEMMCVVVIFVIIGLAILPTMRGMLRDSRVRAAAELSLSRVSMARSLAIDQGRIYTLDVSVDGRQIRVAPDETDAVQDPSQNPANTAKTAQDQLPVDVTLRMLAGTTAAAPAANGDWTRLATFLPDGTCREPLVQFELIEPGNTPVVIEIRGLTGTATEVSNARKQQVSP